MKPLIMSLLILVVIGGVQIGTGSADRPHLSDQGQTSLSVQQEPWNALEARKNEVQAHPNSDEAYCRLGEVYLSVFGGSDKAAAAFKQSISINPNYARAFNGLGWAHLDLNGFNSVFLIPAIRESPDGPEKAVEAYQQALRLKPDYSEAYLGLGMAYGRLGRNAKAIEAYNHALRLGLNCSQVYNELARTYDAVGRYEEALQARTVKIGIDSGQVAPTSPDTRLSFITKGSDDLFWDYTALGELYTKLGRYGEAIEAYKQAIYIRPDHASVHRALGLTYVVVGDKESALAEYKTLMDMYLNSQEEGARYLYRTTAEVIIQQIQK